MIRSNNRPLFPGAAFDVIAATSRPGPRTTRAALR
jgi:hypothetical protein